MLGEPPEEPVASAVPERKITAARTAMKALIPEKTEPEKATPALSGSSKGKLDDAALQMLEKAVSASADEDGRAHLDVSAPISPNRPPILTLATMALPG